MFHGELKSTEKFEVFFLNPTDRQGDGSCHVLKLQISKALVEKSNSCIPDLLRRHGPQKKNNVSANDLMHIQRITIIT